MTINFNAPAPRGPVPNRLPLLCTRCGIDGHISIKSIEALQPASESLVEVSYSCSACGRFYIHPADVAQVAVVLNNSESSQDVLIFGGHYIHCGRPMQKVGSGVRRLHAALNTDRPENPGLDVYLATRVLHCPCGFQMELPE